jgi:hypothetical protein
MTECRFQGGEVVRLRVGRDGVSAGCCGIVWGCYDLEPPLYEASFVGDDGEFIDATFVSEDVDTLADIALARFPERLAEIRRILDRVRR